MGRRLLLLAREAFSHWRHGVVSVRVAAVYVVLLSLIFFLLGGLRPRADYRILQERLESAQNAVRGFSKELTSRNDDLNALRGRERLSEKTIALLNARMEELIAENIRARQQAAFYRQVYGDKTETDGIVIYALEADPGFAPQQWEISAVLARQGKRDKPYAGAYYFEALQSRDDGDKIVRFPPKNRPLEMNFYYEIAETLTLPPNATLKNIRLIVVDENAETIASAALLGADEKAADNNGGEGAPKAVPPAPAEG